MTQVYLNGEFLPLEEAKVSVLDRGFLFGDGVYEVIPAYGGRLFRLEQHLDRLDQSLQGIRLAVSKSHDDWREILQRLLPTGEMGDQAVYLQITRGVAPKRDHSFPVVATPTIFAMAFPVISPEPGQAELGVAAITLPDTRWLRCNIKAITLLANVLLRQQAVDEGAAEAILIRDGVAHEGTASNLFVVEDGVITTPPDGPELLPGITRDLVVELAGLHDLPLIQAPIEESRLFGADELWITSSTKEIVPVISLNERPVGEGVAGPVWRRVWSLFQAYKQQIRAGIVE